MVTSGNQGVVSVVLMGVVGFTVPKSIRVTEALAPTFSWARNRTNDFAEGTVCVRAKSDGRRARSNEAVVSRRDQIIGDRASFGCISFSNLANRSGTLNESKPNNSIVQPY